MDSEQYQDARHNGGARALLKPKVRKIVRVSLSENIAEQIMNSISRGDLRPGQRLPSERDLCKHFGVGRSSLREAIRCLAIIGILDVSVGNGTFVAERATKFLSKILQWRMFTEQLNIEDLMSVRMALEGAAAASAANFGTEKQFNKMDILLNKMQAAKNNPKRFLELDLKFHMLIAEASSNDLLVDLLLMIRRQLRVAVLQFVTLPSGTALACKHHSSLVRALKAHDAAGAVSIMQIHLTISLDRYRKFQINGTNKMIND